jgi:hypothetical protein
MSLKAPYMGEGYAPAYQISATPFVTSSVLSAGETRQVPFGHVTKFVTVRNTVGGTNLAVGFTENGLKPSNSNFITLVGVSELTTDVRVDRLFLSASVGAPAFTVLAGLTPIETKNFLPVTASNGHVGVG